MADSSSTQEWLTWSFSPTLSAIILTLLISLLSPLAVHYYLYKSRASSTVPSFLLLGPSGAGKTSLSTLVCNPPDKSGMDIG